MRLMVLASAIAFGLTTASVAEAGPLGAPMIDGLLNDVRQVQFSRGQSREFGRCMRTKYGPRYYRGVKRAHRYFMAQACGG